MALDTRKLMLTTILSCGVGLAGAGLGCQSGCNDTWIPGTAVVSFSPRLSGFSLSSVSLVADGSNGLYPQYTRSSDLSLAAARLITPELVTLFLIGAVLAALSATDLRRLPQVPAVVCGAQQKRMGVMGRSTARILGRVVEILISGLLLILTSPLMLLIAIMIRLDSPGPAIFRQTRVGKDFVPFTFYKFRTLLANARELFPELYAYDYSPEELATLQFKREHDPRITRVGAWLRRSTLDELPNFLNVLKGDMRLVGPRPEIVEMIKYYDHEHRIKFSVKPGITGLSQINGRGRLSFFETAEYDRKYVLTQSGLGDIKILLTTLKRVILRDGAF